MTSKIIYGCKPFVSSIDNRHHYVYRITNLVEGKHYYGSRSSKLHPFIDLGTKYFGTPSSEKNRWIVQDQKDNPTNYKYKILRCFETRQEATGLEVFIHKKFDVKLHKKFYNESNQTSTGFDTTGRVVMKDAVGTTFLCDIDDPRVLSGELKSVNCGCVIQLDQRIKISSTMKKNVIAGLVFGEEHRKNLSLGSIGKPKQKQHIQNSVQTRKDRKVGMGGNHWKSKYIYHTPWGEFDSPAALEPEFTMQRMKNMCLNSHKKMYPQVYFRCEKLQKTFTEESINKTYKELGFWIITKDEYNPEEN